jgi:N-acetylneuraminic acid mutarotase
MQQPFERPSRRTVLSAVATAAAALAIETKPAAAQGAGGWTRAAPFPRPLSEVYGTSSGARLYVFGGLDRGIVPAGFSYVYDSVSDTWTKNRDMPRAVHHTAQSELNGKLYLFGGFAVSGTSTPGWLPTTFAYEYDPAGDAWRPLAPMPTPRGGAVSVSYNGKLYVIGGAGMHPGQSPAPLAFTGSVHRALGTVEEYDPQTNRWRTLQTMPTPRNHISAAAALGGKIYVIGGRVGSIFMQGADNTDLVEVYDPQTDQWGALLARMPSARSGGGFGVYKGKIYAGGGEYRTNSLVGAFKALEAYAPATDSWTTLSPMPLARHGCAAGFIGNKLHFVGGDIQSSDVFGIPSASPFHDVFEVAEPNG